MLAVLPFPNIDPVLFSFDLFGFTVAIRWYALAYIAGFVLALWWANRALRRNELWRNNEPPMTPKNTEDFLTWAIVGVIAGGRIGYVVAYTNNAYLADPGMIFRVWEGGMSFHGGALGLIVVTLLYARKFKIDTFSLGDIIVLGVPIGIGLGRLANFINAELWGRPTSQPWGVVFPGAPECPITWIPLLCTRHPSQLYEAFLEGVILFALMAYLAYRRGWLEIPGQLIAVFFTAYGAARFIVEFFRQGDAQFTNPANPWGHVIRLGETTTSLGLTMGQLLSLPMMVFGISLLIFVRRR